MSSSSAASGGSFRYANGAGASVTITFNGTYLAWITKNSAAYGVASVTLDGAGPVTVDLYKATTVWQQKVWETGILPAGTHTVTIAWTGDKNAAAADTNVSVDAFDLQGTLTAPVVAPAMAAPLAASISVSTAVASPLMIDTQSTDELAFLIVPPWDEAWWLSPTGWGPTLPAG